jgi:hypothetical protein
MLEHPLLDVACSLTLDSDIRPSRKKKTKKSHFGLAAAKTLVIFAPH